jgi:hypothetical protein
MNILDDLKMQYKLGGIAHRLIYWNVACFLVSLVFFFFSAGSFYFPIGLLSTEPAFWIKAMDVRNVFVFHDGFGIYFFNMMVIFPVLCFDFFLHRSNCWVCTF